MRRVSCAVALTALVLSGFGGLLQRVTTVAAQSIDGNAYFDGLVARADVWKAYSLRDPKQLDYPANGGYADSNSTFVGKWVNYDPTHDTDPQKQDAAKVVLPAFAWPYANCVLTSSVGPSDTTFSLAQVLGTLNEGRQILIDSEVATITSYNTTTNTITVTRGQFGTTAASHPANSVVKVSSNGLLNDVRLPIGTTTDGNTYLLTWDAYYTNSFVNSGLLNHKAFQVSAGRDARDFLEVDSTYQGGMSRSDQPPGWNSQTDVGGVFLRRYGSPGPLLTSDDPVRPYLTGFAIKPGVWTRYWLQIQQNANDYERITLWMADENRGPVMMYSPDTTQVGLLDPSMSKFWIEFNTSTYQWTRGDMRDLVLYVRNFVMLVNPGDVSSLLVRPASGTTGPPPPPNVRIVH